MSPTDVRWRGSSWLNMISRRRALVALLAGTLAISAGHARAQSDPLPSWNDGAAKKSITDFVARVTTQGGADFVPPAERIATFDNDGTLWCEQPMYFQARLRARPRQGDGAAASGMEAASSRSRRCSTATRRRLPPGRQRALTQIMAATHAGMTTDEFAKSVADWLATARHPRFNRPYNELIYQPMVELLAYLRANGFKTFIVSGGGVEFMRPWTEKVYGIPPEQVVGSSGVVKFEIGSGRQAGADEARQDRVRRRRPRQAGRHQPLHRPAADLRVRQFRRRPADAAMDRRRARARASPASCTTPTTSANTPTTGQSQIGKLDKAWDEAKLRGWTIVDMKQDWKKVFPPVSTVGGAMEKKP